MRKAISSMMVTLDGFFEGPRGDWHNVDEGFHDYANDLLFAQGLLALIFLFAGGVKLLLPLGVLTEQILLPGMFVRFIGVAEVLGAISLILPGLLRTWLGLISLAAVALVIIMIGVTPVRDVALVLIPLVGLLLAFVAYGRSRLRPTGSRSTDPGYRPLATGS